MNVNSAPRQNMRFRMSERLSRLGILDEPVGYVDGANLYQFVESDPVGYTDPLGLQPATKPGGPTTKPGAPTTQPGGPYTINDPDPPNDRQGDAYISVKGKHLCSTTEKGTIELEVRYKLDHGLPSGTEPSDEGSLIINGQKTDLVKNGTGNDDFTARWTTDMAADGKGHSGRIYVAVIWNPRVLSPEDDPHKKGRTGAIHAWTIKWSFDCNCGTSSGLKTEIKYIQEPEGNLPVKDPGG